MLRPSEVELFETYRTKPTLDHLSNLLRFHQGRAYNLCYQSLAIREDAEDAAQDALIRVVSCLPRIESARAFRHWLYRICLTCAIRVRDQRQRRHNHESRYSMTAEPSAPANDVCSREQKAAVVAALHRLDDPLRSLIVEHYYEKSPLEDIAVREGVSRTAIWKRIDRARQALKESLATLGMTALVPDPMPLLEASAPATLSTDLVPGVLAKVMAPSAGPLCKGSLTSATKVLALGGLVMTVKQSTWTTVAITAAILIGIAVVAVPRKRVLDVTQPGAGISRPQTSSEAAPGPLVPSPGGAAPAPAPKRTADTAQQPAGERTLKARLEEYFAKMDRLFPERDAMRRATQMTLEDLTAVMSNPGLQDRVKAAAEYIERFEAWKIQELAGVKDLISSDAAGFLEFFTSAPGVQLQGLLNAVFGLNPLGDSASGEFVSVEQSTVPAALWDGLLALLPTAGLEHKREILNFAGHLKNKAEPFGSVCRALWSDPDPGVQYQALAQYNDPRPLMEKDVRLLESVVSDAGKEEGVREAVRILAMARPPGFEDVVLRVAGTTKDFDHARTLLDALTAGYLQQKSENPSFEGKLLGARAQSLALCADPDLFKESVLQCMREFQVARVLPYLDRAAGVAPTSELAGQLRSVAGAIRTGTTNLPDLMKILNR